MASEGETKPVAEVSASDLKFRSIVASGANAVSSLFAISGGFHLGLLPQIARSEGIEGWALAYPILANAFGRAVAAIPAVLSLEVYGRTYMHTIAWVLCATACAVLSLFHGPHALSLCFLAMGLGDGIYANVFLPSTSADATDGPSFKSLCVMLFPALAGLAASNSNIEFRGAMWIFAVVFTLVCVMYRQLLNPPKHEKLSPKFTPLSTVASDIKSALVSREVTSIAFSKFALRAVLFGAFYLALPISIESQLPVFDADVTMAGFSSFGVLVTLLTLTFSAANVPAGFLETHLGNKRATNIVTFLSICALLGLTFTTSADPRVGLTLNVLLALFLGMTEVLVSRHSDAAFGARARTDGSTLKALISGLGDAGYLVGPMVCSFANFAGEAYFPSEDFLGEPTRQFGFLGLAVVAACAGVYASTAGNDAVAPKVDLEAATAAFTIDE